MLALGKDPSPQGQSKEVDTEFANSAQDTTTNSEVTKYVLAPTGTKHSRTQMNQTT